jgi:hypothetical protein
MASNRLIFHIGGNRGQARRLHEAWRIPAEVLIQPPRPRNRAAAA